jgi:hypothetical protein
MQKLLEHDTTLLIKMDSQHEFRKYTYVTLLIKLACLRNFKEKIQSRRWKSFEIYPSKKLL